MIRRNPNGDIPVVHESAFVDPTAILCGKVIVKENVFIGPYAVIRADEVNDDGDMEPIVIGAGSNIQDGVVIHALKDKHVRVGGEPWAVYVGRDVSMAHDALVHGPCYIGDDTFVGFKAVVHDAVVGSHCYIGIGAVVVGVEVPDGRFVPHGAIIDTADAVERLSLVSDVHREFTEDVVEVNRGLVAAYREHEEGPAAVRPRATEVERRGPSWDQRWQPDRDPSRF